MAGHDEVLVQGDGSQKGSNQLNDGTADKLRHGIYNENGHRISGGLENYHHDTSSRHLPDMLIDESGNGSGGGVSGKAEIAVGKADNFVQSTIDKLSTLVEKADIKDMFFHKHEPSQQEVSDAQKKLDKQIDELLPDDRKQNLKGLQDAALGGDPKAMADAVSKIDPKDLPAYIKELNKNLDATNAGLHAQVDKAGNVVMYGDNGNKAVEIAPNGQTTVRAIEREPDGTVVMKDGEVLGADPCKVMKGLSNDAVNNVNDPFGGILKPEQPPRIWPELPPDFPHKPWEDPGIMPDKPRWEDPGFAPKQWKDHPITIDPRWLEMNMNNKREDILL